MNKNTISKWFSMFLLMMVAGITGATAQSLTVADFNLDPGQSTEVNITLAAPADQTIYGIQTDITLSEGLTLEEVAAVNAELQFDQNTLTGGATRVALLSLANASLPAGDVIKLHVKATDNFESGTITLANSKLTTSTAGAEITIDGSTANVTKTPVVEEDEFDFFYWPSGASQANSITLAEGVTIAITGNTSKNIQNGNDITIDGTKYKTMKVSNGAQNTLTLAKKAKSITFYSYINKASTATGLRDTYWKEIAGENYDAETSGGLMTCFSDGIFSNPDVRTYTFNEPLDVITFTNAGEQVCYVIKVVYAKEETPTPVETTATFNFADPNFREKIGTAMTDVDGYIYNETFTADGASLQITGGSAPSRIYVDANRGQNLVTYQQYSTLTFKAPEGKAITKIEFTAAGNSNIRNFIASSDSINGMVWTGNAEGVRFTQGGTSYLANAILTMVDKTAETKALPAIEYTQCDNIAAFNALEAGTYAKVTLTDAEVIGKSADGYSTVWVQDATGGCWIQYTSLNSLLNEKTKVNGTIYTIKRNFSGNAQIKEAEATINSELNATAIDSYSTIAGTIDEVNVAANLNKVVKIAADSLMMTSATAGKLYVGETSIDVTNGTATGNQQLCKIADWEKDKVLRNITIEAILVAKSATANQLLPISIVETTTPEPPVVPTITATLEHTATSYCEGDADVYTSNVDAETEHVNNNKFNSTWEGAAYAEFSFAELPANATITEAILTFKGIGESRNARNTDVMLVNAGETLDYTALAAGNAKVNLAAANIQSVSFPKASSQVFTINATEQLNALVAGGQRYAIFKFTNNPGGGDIAGKTSEDAPTLVITYALGAPAIANASFDANAADVITVTTQGYQRNIPEGSDQITGLQPVTGWTPGTQTESDPGYVAGVFAYGSQNLLNNKVAAPATAPEGSTSPSALGLSAVWGGIAQYTQEVTAPAGDYKLSYTVYNGANTGAVTKNLFGFIANNGTEYLSDVKTFTVGEWATYDVTFTLDEETTGKISVGFIGSGGSGNAPHLFLDNVKLEKIPGIEVALKELEKAIAAAQEKAGSYTIGEGLFMYAASEIEPLNTAIATAQGAYTAAESKAAVETATATLNAFVETFAPVATTPDADKAYTFELRLGGETPLYMALAESGITIAEEATPLKFVAVEGADGQYNLTNEDGTLFVGLAGGDAWTMSTLADKKAAWTFTALPDGAYRINNLVTAGRFVGTNTADKEAGKPCYADKRTDNGNVDWLIAEYVAPTELAQTLNVERYAGLGYTAQEATVDFTEAKTFLGVEAITTDMLRIVNPDGTQISDYATYDGWFNGQGAAETWGTNTKINVKFFQAIPEGTYTICDMNGADSIGATYTVKWALVANEKQVTYTINVKFVEKPVITLTFADLNKVEEKTVALTSELGKSYEGLTADVDVAAILTKLEVTSLNDLTIYAVQSDGSLDDQYKLGTTDGWRNAAGDWQTWGDNAYFCVKTDFAAESSQIYYVGGMDGKNTTAEWETPASYTATYAFVKTGTTDAVVLKVTLTYTVPTGINAIARDAQKSVIYNMNGQKMNKAQRGLYIINGKKVVVK